MKDYSALVEQLQLPLRRILQADQWFTIIQQMQGLSFERKCTIINGILQATGHPSIDDNAGKILQADYQGLDQLPLEPSDLSNLIRALGDSDMPQLWQQELEAVTGVVTIPPDEEEVKLVTAQVEQEWEDLITEHAEQLDELHQQLQQATPNSPTDELPLDSDDVDSSEEPNLPDDNWDIVMCCYNPIQQVHQLSLLRHGGQVTIETEREDGFGNEKQKPLALGSALHWNLPGDVQDSLSALSRNFKTPVCATLSSALQQLQEEHGPFDRLYILQLDIDCPNPSSRQEVIDGGSIHAERHRSFQWTGPQATATMAVDITWPNNYTLVDPHHKTPKGWAMIRNPASKRKVQEKWQVRSRWKLVLRQLHGQQELPPIIVSTGGTASCKLKDKGLHRGTIKSSSGVFASLSDNHKNRHYIEQPIHPTQLNWESDIDYSSDMMQILNDNETIELQELSQSLQEHRRLTLRQTPLIDSTAESSLRGDQRFYRENLQASFVCEQDLAHLNPSPSDGTRYHGSISSRWTGPQHIAIPISTSQTIQISFVQPHQPPIEDQTEHPNSNVTHHEHQQSFQSIATIQCAEKQWVVDFLLHKTRISHTITQQATELRQQGWISSLATTPQQTPVRLHTSMEQSACGFQVRLEK